MTKTLKSFAVEFGVRLTRNGSSLVDGLGSKADIVRLSSFCEKQARRGQVFLIALTNLGVKSFTIISKPRTPDSRMGFCSYRRRKHFHP